MGYVTEVCVRQAPSDCEVTRVRDVSGECSLGEQAVLCGQSSKYTVTCQTPCRWMQHMVLSVCDLPDSMQRHAYLCNAWCIVYAMYV